jgi:hypothetical protein
MSFTICIQKLWRFYCKDKSLWKTIRWNAYLDNVDCVSQKMAIVKEQTHDSLKGCNVSSNTFWTLLYSRWYQLVYPGGIWRPSIAGHLVLDRALRSIPSVWSFDLCSSIQPATIYSSKASDLVLSCEPRPCTPHFVALATKCTQLLAMACTQHVQNNNELASS